MLKQKPIIINTLIVNAKYADIALKNLLIGIWIYRKVEHCKVYYRLDGDFDQKGMFVIFLLQLFSVFAWFYLTLFASFYYFRGKLLKLFNANINRNYFLIVIAYFSAFVIFVMTKPFVVLLFLYYP